MLQKIKLLAIVALNAALYTSVPVQAVTPSPQMIEQFKTLPASEQQRLAKQYGIDPSALSGQTSQSNQFQQATEMPERYTSSKEQLSAKENEKNNLNFEEDSKKDELTFFGYDMFAGEPMTFSPISDIPVPSDYMVGPGDTLNVQLYGKDNREYSLTIGRDGNIQFPELGPISVVGLTFSELREYLGERIQKQMIGIESNITLGELRSIRIFIAGDAYKPGSYTVSSLSTITQALFAAGGVNEIGSLRNIQVKRQGQLVGSFDLYDLLLKGDASKDINLRSGDVVFIPSVGGRVSITGEIRRPAIYEIKSNETIDDVVKMAAGVNPGAYPKRSSIERYNNNGLKNIVNVDLTTAEAAEKLAKAGDHIRVKSASTQYEDAITLVGAVVRPGKYQWYQGQKVNDLLPTIWGDLAISADLNYALIIREVNKFGKIEVLQFSPGKAISQQVQSENIALSPRDKVILFNYDDSSINRYELNKLVQKRAEKIKSLSSDSLIGSDLFKAGFKSMNIGNASSMMQQASIGGVVLPGSNNELDEEEQLIGDEVSKMLSNLFDDRDLIKLSGSMSREELLFPIISKLSQQSSPLEKAQVVAISGKVKNGGIYPLATNAKVSDLLVAAGGLVEGAYTNRAELTRTENSDSLSDINHIHVNINNAINHLPSDDLLLEGRDMLVVLTTPEWQERKSIEIRGEVKFPGMYNIRRGETLADVMQRAGGFTDFAFPTAAVFVRESVKQQEQLEIKKLADQLRRDIATRGVSKDGTVVNYSEAQLMLTDLENIQAVGRLVVDLNAIQVGIEQADIQLEDKDILYVPTTKQIVSVMGEVQHPSTHRFKEGITLDQYLSMSGGPRERADDDRTYIIKADGSVMLPKQSFWFSSKAALSAGDTVIVPLDTEYKDNLTLWTQVTQIVYNSAVALATISGL
ncbi:SLBB domain-containing protein [Shewanella sp. 10N.286.48.B5]|uniref:SLBB domain-containing protein n=1 Tax=Shewanella sp. 10N.286.48.B5 TaxID=1880834 RepID=UPI000CAE0D97|nr:SLBB domain-containing protein [Shewanella sp. 10N.286.48.B5]PMH84382.1 sugar transporter [Shewanella sp. 10N.286.48.B5]